MEYTAEIEAVRNKSERMSVFTFLELPGELRNTIYSECLTHPYICFGSGSCEDGINLQIDGSGENAKCSSLSVVFRLARLNRQIRREALGFFFKHYALVCPHMDLPSIYDNLPREVKSAVTSIQIPDFSLMPQVGFWTIPERFETMDLSAHGIFQRHLKDELPALTSLRIWVMDGAHICRRVCRRGPTGPPRFVAAKEEDRWLRRAVYWSGVKWLNGVRNLERLEIAYDTECFGCSRDACKGQSFMDKLFEQIRKDCIPSSGRALTMTDELSVMRL